MAASDPRTLQSYMAQIQRTPLLTRDEENELARRWVEHRDEAAAAELIRRNLRFVVKVAMGYRKYGLPVQDLIQEGNLGLMRAVEKFDPDKGTRLISYAVWWIKAYIQSHIISSWSLVRVGTTQTQRRLFYKLPGMLEEGLRGGETAEEQVQRIAEELQARPRDVRRMAGALSGRDLSLDAPLDGDGGATFGDRMGDDRGNPEELVAEQEDDSMQKHLLRECLAQLPQREQSIIRLRHLEGDGMTLRQVGRELGISRERVRQLEVQALRRLGAMMRSRYQGQVRVA